MSQSALAAKLGKERKGGTDRLLDPEHAKPHGSARGKPLRTVGKRVRMIVSDAS